MQMHLHTDKQKSKAIITECWRDPFFCRCYLMLKYSKL